jgi:hydroxyacid-oxoacid transhydrogenase
MSFETAFTMEGSSIKFGPGVTREVGEDLKRFAVKRVLVFVDPNLLNSQAVETVLESIKAQNIDATVFNEIRIEPTDASFKAAINAATDGKFDGFVAVGGGSTIDTAKAANLYATYPADFLEYVNAPIGKGTPVPGPLKPLVAIPTTAGTGSETTGVAIFDLLEQRVKTGIAHRALRPVLGIIDPEHTKTLPPLVAACSALDILSHAVESLTALPYHQRPAPENSTVRPAYQGSNPISDIWSAKAIELVAEYLPRVLADSDDDEARGQLLLAATFAGIGFGNAGVHLPHGMSYPVSGMVRDFKPADYKVDHPIVPHGMSVILNAPAVFRFTASANPQKHLYAAKLLGVDVSEASEEEAGNILADALIAVMKQTGMPNGLSALGFSEADVEKLAEGTLPQHRVTKLSPRSASKEDLMRLFKDALGYW